MIERVKEFPVLSDYLVYHNTYLENHFEVLIIPSRWKFEQLESWAPNTLWTMANDKAKIIQESEGYKGRSDYAIKEGGGYYASRLAVLEGLNRMRRQGAVVVIREAYEGYLMPVGVWEVRENVRIALRKKSRRFSTLKEAVDDINSRLRIPVEEYIRRSVVLRQRRLDEF